MKSFFIFTVSSEPFLPDILSSLLWELPITGITEEADHLKIFSDAEEHLNEKVIGNVLSKLVEEKLISDFRIEKDILEDKNWNEIWEKGRDIIRATERIIIKPTFKEYTQRENEIVLTIDPKMSFGTGDHQTTKLVLSFLEKYVTPSMKVLDVGSGTGILAIAAVKLGAGYSAAIDNDEWCYDNCLENCYQNNVQDKVKVYFGELDGINESGFDLIAANIQKDSLVDLAESIKKKININGILILSGLLHPDKVDIISRYEKLNFKLVETSALDEWVAVVFRSE